MKKYLARTLNKNDQPKTAKKRPEKQRQQRDSGMNEMMTGHMDYRQTAQPSAKVGGLSHKQRKMMTGCLKKYSQLYGNSRQQLVIKDKILQILNRGSSNRYINPSENCICRNNPRVCRQLHQRHMETLLTEEIDNLQQKYCNIKSDQAFFLEVLKKRQSDPLNKLQELREEQMQQQWMIEQLDQQIQQFSF